MPIFSSKRFLITLSLTIIDINELIRFIKNKSSIRIGEKRFLVIIDNAIYCYYPPDAAIVVSCFVLPFFLLAGPMIVEHLGMDIIKETNWFLPCYGLTLIYLFTFNFTEKRFFTDWNKYLNRKI